MAVTTRKPKSTTKARSTPRPTSIEEFGIFTLADQMKDAALNTLLMLDSGSKHLWVNLCGSNGASDSMIYYLLNDIWSSGARCDAPEAYASSSSGTPLVWFGQSHGKGSPSLSGDELVDTVRRVLSIPPASSNGQASGESPGHESDDTVLRRSLSRTSAFDPLIKSGADDAQILVAIRARWQMAKVGGLGRPYYVLLNDARWGTAIWFDAIGATDDEPSLYHRQKPNGGTEGTLIAEVRRVLGIPGVNGAMSTTEATADAPATSDHPLECKNCGTDIIQAVVAKSKNGRAKTPAKGAAKAGRDDAAAGKSVEAPVDPMAGIEVIEERDVPWGEINRSRFNPRTIFDEDLIASMEPSIETICRLTPLTIREGSNELIDGETRHRAGERRKPALRCKIVRCTDAQAAVMRLSSAVKRRDLDPIARARAMKSLQESHGYTQSQVAEFAELKEQSSVSNLTRLLELPDRWQQRVISKEITAADAREIVPWINEPEVMKELDAGFKDARKYDRAFNVSGRLNHALNENSRPITDSDYWQNGRYRKVALKPTPAQAEQLRIREVKNRGKRAFNVSLWEELQAADEKARAAREAKRNDSGKSGSKAVDPKKAAENRAKQAQILAKKVYRFRVAWHQAMAVACLPDAENTDLIALLLFVSTNRDGTDERGDILEELIQTPKSKKHQAKTRDEGNGTLSALLAQAQGPQLSTIQKILERQLSGPFDNYHPVFEPAVIEQIAQYLGVDVARDWRTSFDDEAPCAHLWPDFLGLWSKDQIVELLAEWKVKNPLGDSAKRADLVALLRSDKPCPKAIVAAKPVRLT